MMFFNFLNSFWNFLARVGRERNSERKFYLSFSSYLSPVWIEILPEWCFLTFRYFFWNFLAQVRKEQNSEQNFFSLFPGLSQPGLDRNNAGMMYFNFLFFFFLEFFSPSRVGTEFGTKFFFALSRPISVRFG